MKQSTARILNERSLVTGWAFAGWAILRLLVREYPSEKQNTICIIVWQDLFIVRQALLNGAKGFLSKDNCFDELVTAIRTIHNGEVHVGKRARTVVGGDGS